MEQLKQFRQAGSSTPGHPEFRMTSGVEAGRPKRSDIRTTRTDDSKRTKNSKPKNEDSAWSETFRGV